MSETVKNSFFRFVTLRSPELATEKEKKDYHVHYEPGETESHFADELEDPADTPALQATALAAKAATFTALSGTDALKTAVGATLFDLSVWLAKNKTAVFNQDLVYSGTYPSILEERTFLWDNLFYQLITGKNPLLRQQIMEVLVAIAYLEADEGWQHQLAQARVVIPSAFFGPAEQVSATRIPSEDAPADPPVYTGDLKVIAKSAVATEKIKVLQSLSEELSRAEKKYALLNNAAYNTARKEYDDDLKVTLREYYSEDALPDPASDAEPSTERGIEQGPDIAAFEFTPANEMQDTFIEQYLSARSLQLAEDLGFADDTKFTEAFAVINDELKKLSADAAVSAQAGTRSLVVNGLAFPVNQGILPPPDQYTFYMLPLIWRGNHLSILTTINMGQPGMHVVSCSYQAFTGGTISGSAFEETTQGNSLTLKLFPGAGMTIPSGITYFNVVGEIELANGTTLSFNAVFDTREGGGGIMQFEAAPGEGGDDGDIGIGAPSGYGVRRIGVADYRKVEQSVCCYVPGEVSHIENVMAREYKEKSSRRLSRIEDTTTLETSMEKESQKDTSTTERNELQKEVNSVLSQQKSTDTHANVNGDFGKIAFDAGSSIAFNTSKEDSNREAVNYSKEVTEKALERVVQKVREERTIKVVEEFEEQNKHGFDNRKGNTHVSGVYRWIDKVYKNQVFNYGKRLMYEFMVPQPAVFHNEAIKVAAKLPTATILEKPVDPRTTANGIYPIPDYQKINTVTFPYWAGVYNNSDFTAAPDQEISVSQAFEVGSKETTGEGVTASKVGKMEIPEGYEAVKIRAGVSYVYSKSGLSPFAAVRVANSGPIVITNSSGDRELDINTSANPIRKEIGVSMESRNLGGLIVNVTATCRRTLESYEKWQIDSYNNLIAAYNERLDAYNQAMEVLKSKTVDTETKQTNPSFYRQIENIILRKNCIAYMVKHDNMGSERFYKQGTTGEIRPLDTPGMDKYAALVKFMEQAFEWDVMSYKFYPFYWGYKGDWQQAYQQDVSDELFRAFLQSGMARVIVSVRPGFEEAVMYFMATGKVWNGGAVPAIGDDLYLSIVEELKKPTYYVDETWETRVPTTLTLIQAGSIGLTTEGLPCECGDTENFIDQTTALLSGDDDDDDGGDDEGGDDPEGEDPPNPEGGE